MRFHREARREAYDVVIVGSGIGGLTAGALLARAGQSVLIVERHDRPGGYAHSFRRQRYHFDSAVHLAGGCGPVSPPGEGVIHRLLCTLGLDDRCTFEPVNPCYTAVYPGWEMPVPTGTEAFIAAHGAAFPGEAAGIRRIVEECLDIRRETREAARLSPAHAQRSSARVPTLMKYRRATLADVLDDHLDDARAKTALATLWPYLGLPPSRLSFLYWAGMLASYVADGTYYCRGTFQRLANTIAKSVEADGGEVLLRTPVRRIRVEQERVAGIVLENGQRIDAPVVISNADLPQTVEELIGVERFPDRWVERLRRMRPSVSAFMVYAAVDRALPLPDAVHETFVYTAWDHDAAYRSAMAGEPSWLTITVPTLADPGLAPPGEHTLILTTLVAYDAVSGWRTEKDRYVEHLLDLAETRLPRLRSHLRFREGATPRTMERYTRNTEGAIYGWDLSPRNVSSKRPGPDTPVPGLYLAGHWAQPGGGIYGVVTSGVQTAAAVLGHASEPDLWATVGG